MSFLRSAVQFNHSMKLFLREKHWHRQVTTRSGALYPEPPSTQFGVLRVLATVIPGLLIGAAISKHIANFLEENDLFVPSDDDDDDD